jgi:hypothetical protein
MRQAPAARGSDAGEGQAFIVAFLRFGLANTAPRVTEAHNTSDDKLIKSSC